LGLAGAGLLYNGDQRTQTAKKLKLAKQQGLDFFNTLKASGVNINGLTPDQFSNLSPPDQKAMLGYLTRKQAVTKPVPEYLNGSVKFITPTPGMQLPPGASLQPPKAPPAPHLPNVAQARALANHPGATVADLIQHPEWINEAATQLANESSGRAMGRAAGLMNLREGEAVKLAQDKFDATPMTESKFFAVDPKTFKAVPLDAYATMGDAKKAGASLVPNSVQGIYNQGTTALDNLGAIEEAGAKVLPKSGSVTYLTEGYIKSRAILGDPDARAYEASSADLIATLRTLAGTSRPNQAEIQTSLRSLQGAANQKQLTAALGQARKAIRNTLRNMTRFGNAAAVKASLDTVSPPSDDDLIGEYTH